MVFDEEDTAGRGYELYSTRDGCNLLVHVWRGAGPENELLRLSLTEPGAPTWIFRGFDARYRVVDGKIVCGFRDGEGKSQTIDLTEGLVPIVSVGYVRQTRRTSVHWKPPGQEEWSEIPSKLLFH